MKIISIFALILLCLSGCYRGHWDGYAAETPIEKYAEDACDCLKREVKKSGTDVADLMERALRLDGYRKEGFPVGITQEMAMQELEEFKILRTRARESFRNFREIACVKKLMRNVEKRGETFTNLGKVLDTHCLLARAFTELAEY